MPLSRVVSGSGVGASSKLGGPSSGATSNAGTSGSEEQDTDALYDVAEHFVVELDGKVQVALAERVRVILFMRNRIGSRNGSAGLRGASDIAIIGA